MEVHQVVMDVYDDIIVLQDHIVLQHVLSDILVRRERKLRRNVL